MSAEGWLHAHFQKWTSARATDTLLSLALFTAASQPRPDDIFSHGFQN